MPRYIVERQFDVKHEGMPQVGSSSRRILVEEMPQITWELSHVAVDDSGGVKTYCIYEAPDEDAIRTHAQKLGAHNIVAVAELAGDVTPEDFPLD
jgi:Nickel responsive protein SCO4226-like